MLSNILYLAPLPLLYLLGALPTGYLLARSQGLDIRSAGSGNVGATNIARVLGKKMGILTLFIDAGKGFLAVLLSSFISHGDLSYMGLGALACVAGHCFSIPGKLIGGKGVATALGTLFGLHLVLPLVALTTFIISMLLTKVVSVSSLAATSAVVVAALFLGLPEGAWVSLAFMSLIIFYRHKENLTRLVRGEEKKFSLSKGST